MREETSEVAGRTGSALCDWGGHRETADATGSGSGVEPVGALGQAADSELPCTRRSGPDPPRHRGKVPVIGIPETGRARAPTPAPHTWQI